MKKITLVLFVFFTNIVFAQTEDLLYKNEYSFGININTQGGLFGGGVFRYARAISPKIYHSFSVEAVEVKHPKEQRRSSQFTGQMFTPGKQNSLYLIRPQYGREIILFRKAAEQGVQVNFIGAIGPTLGLVAPYLIRYKYRNGLEVSEQYDPSKHTSFDAVVAEVGFSESLSQSKFEVGASAKVSLVFEFGNFRSNVAGVEVGFMSDYMLNKVVLMPLSENKQFFNSTFITIFYGGRN